MMEIRSAVAHLSFFVAYPAVELLPLQTYEVVAGQQDATLGGDGSSGVDVVPGHHADGDAGTLTFFNRIWNLKQTPKRFYNLWYRK